MTARLHCIVPFCRRTRGQRKGEPPIREGEEWICGPHWQRVSQFNKRVMRAARKKMRAIPHDHRAYWKLKPGSPERIASVDAGRLWTWAWARCKAAAIEAAGGIA